MIDIAKKKLPKAVVMILVYVGYCAAQWYVMRGNMAYYGESYEWPSWFANDVWAFFLGGVFPFAVYEIVSRFVSRMLVAKTYGGDISSLKYGLDLTVAATGIFLFLIKLTYLAYPLQAAVVNIILDPVVTIGFVSLYLWYAFYRGYVDKTHYRTVVSNVLGMFLAVYGLLAVVNLIVTVI